MNGVHRIDTRGDPEGRCIISTDVWFKRDIANALLATYQAAVETAVVMGGDPHRQAIFLSGYRSAISTLALFFGISPGSVLPAQDVPLLNDVNR